MSAKALGPRSRPETWKHGRSCYANHACRCEVCRLDNAAYQRERPRPRRVMASQQTVRSDVQAASIPLATYRSTDATWPELVAAVLAEATP